MSACVWRERERDATHRKAPDPAGSTSGSGAPAGRERRQSVVWAISVGRAHSARKMVAPPSNRTGSSSSGSSAPKLCTLITPRIPRTSCLYASEPPQPPTRRLGCRESLPLDLHPTRWPTYLKTARCNAVTSTNWSKEKWDQSRNSTPRLYEFTILVCHTRLTPTLLISCAQLCVPHPCRLTYASCARGS